MIGIEPNPWIEALATYEPGRPIDEVARELGFADASEIVKLASNENALGPSSRAVMAVREAASEMHRYPDGGCYYLRQALAERLEVDPAAVVVGNGSNELIVLLVHAFLQPGDNVVVSEMAFIVYRLVTAAFRGEVREVPMRDWTHDLKAMLEAVDERTRLIFVANPNNPTGTAVHLGDVEWFLSQIPEDVLVIFDEAYFEFLPAGKRPDVLAHVRKDRPVVVLRTFSKIYGLAGMRIGYAVAPLRTARAMHKVRQPFNVNSLAQVAALAALGDDEHVKSTREVVDAGREFLEGRFTQMGLEYVPSRTNFILLKSGRGRHVFEELQKEGVIVRPMDGYGLPEFIRVTIGTQDQNERFIAALKRVLSKSRG